jgi:hypothetical protein
MDLSNENVIHIKKGKVEYLQFRKLLEYSDKISHAYSLGLNMNFRSARANREPLSKEEFENTIKCYEDLCNAINVDYKNVIKPNQAHTDNIKIVDKKIRENELDINLDEYYKTDGLITDKKNLVLSSTNADCILMLFYDPVKNVVANIHSGWRGTLQRISAKAVDKMVKEKGCNPQNIICCICPSIRKCHFEVERDVFELFYNEFSNFENIDEIITKQSNKEKWNIDTVLINKILLQECGLNAQNIIDSGICSVCNKDIVHSYRAEGQSFGLATALICIHDN